MRVSEIIRSKLHIKLDEEIDVKDLLSLSNMFKSFKLDEDIDIKDIKTALMYNIEFTKFVLDNIKIIINEAKD